MKLLFASCGNGITVYDKSIIDPGTSDYYKIAFITNGGNITYYDKKVNQKNRLKIESYAKEIKEKFQARFEAMDILTQYYTILDNVPTTKNGMMSLRSLAKSAESISEKLPRLRKIYYKTA